MTNNSQHAEGILQCTSVFAGPCFCGPAVHINLGLVKGDITATCVLSLADCEGLIKQIRRSMKAVKSVTPSATSDLGGDAAQ